MKVGSGGLATGAKLVVPVGLLVETLGLTVGIVQFDGAGVFVVRRKNIAKIGYRSPLFPVPQIIFLTLSIWILIYLVYEQPLETSLGLLNIILGVFIYKLDVSYSKRKMD